MKQYLLLLRGGLNFTAATEEQVQEAMTRWKAWMEQLGQQGKMIPGHRLTSKGKVLTGKRKEMTDGPYTEGKEIVGGYMILLANSLDEATEIANDCPIFYYDGIVEVREIIVN
jgi:hypothetical protein